MTHRVIYIVGLAVASIFLLILVGAAGTMTFTNDTGAVATGIRIEFSSNATITWHSGEFRVQDPTGFGTEFAFSGGAVQPDGTFTISWGPSTAKIEGYEWITEQSAFASAPSEQKESTASSQGGALLYGNAYPGPDEPLYQPKPDEKIWLTDLEGHGDIYDNDGIKINFAPDFDRSKITEIIWWRNGVPLEFVNPEDKVTTLTNALMKTFDGNYLEHSPASSHTDHAIAGYEYTAGVFLKNGDMKRISTTIESTFKWHPKEVWAETGINWHWSDLDGIPYDSIVKFFKYLKQDGFTGISMVIPYYVMTPYGYDLFEQHTVDYSITNWEIVTPTTSELEKMLKAADDAGLDKQVMGFFYVSKSYIDAHKDRYIGKGMIDPKNPELFFRNYTQLLEKIIPLLNKYNVKSLVVLDETDTLDLKYPDLIEDMLTELSEEFKGKLGIDISANHMLEDRFGEYGVSSWQQAVNKMTFLGWKSPDGKKLEALYSCWTPPLETQKDQRVSVMTRNFVKFWKPLFDYVSSTYSNPPQGFGEIGTRNADGGCFGPDYYKIPHNQRVFDEQERADIWYAYLKGAKELGIESLNVWMFTLGDTRWGDHSPGTNFMYAGFKQSKSPAYRVITSIIGPNTSTSE